MPYANNAGVRIHYEVEGEGPPLVMMHGLMGNRNDYCILSYAQALRQDYRLILLDARGCGESDKFYDPALYRADLIAGDVVAVLDHLGVETAHYFGYSMGAHMGYYAIARYVLGRFRSLILGGASGPPRITEAQKQFGAALVQGIEMAAKQGMPAYLANYERTMGALPEERKAQMLNIDSRARLALAKAIFRWTAPEDVLREIMVPCLAYAGSRDPAYETAEESAALIPNAKFIAFPDLDHVQAGFRSGLVLPHILSFLAEIGEG